MQCKNDNPQRDKAKWRQFSLKNLIAVVTAVCVCISTEDMIFPLVWLCITGLWIVVRFGGYRDSGWEGILVIAWIVFTVRALTMMTMMMPPYDLACPFVVFVFVLFALRCLVMSVSR